MSGHERFEYVLHLQGWKKPADGPGTFDLSSRVATRSDLLPLAGLMLEAYRGTIDYEGEGMAEAVAEVERYLAPSPGNWPLLEYSTLLTDSVTLVAACLVMYWGRGHGPLVAYIISHPSRKRRGLALRALGESISRLAVDGHHEVRAIITKGNLPSEGLFLKLGFTRVSAG